MQRQVEPFLTAASTSKCRTASSRASSAEQVFAYAEVHGGDQTVDKAMTRLLALAEYRHFCEMMHRYSEEEELASGMRVMGM